MSADDRRDGDNGQPIGSDRHAQTAAATAYPASATDSAATVPGEPSDGVSGNVPDQASRRAHLRVSRVSPWSVLRFSFVVSLVCFIVLFVAVAVLYGVLALLGVFEALNTVINSLAPAGGNVFSASRVLGYTALVGGINVVLITLLATVGAFIYNLAADLVGGIELTLTERQ